MLAFWTIFLLRKKSFRVNSFKNLDKLNRFCSDLFDWLSKFQSMTECFLLTILAISTASAAVFYPKMLAQNKQQIGESESVASTHRNDSTIPTSESSSGKKHRLQLESRDRKVNSLNFDDGCDQTKVKPNFLLNKWIHSTVWPIFAAF